MVATEASRSVDAVATSQPDEGTAVAPRATPQRDGIPQSPATATGTTDAVARTGAGPAETALATLQSDAKLQQPPTERPQPASTNAPEPTTVLQADAGGARPPLAGAAGPVPPDTALPASFVVGFTPSPLFGLPPSIGAPVASPPPPAASQENPAAPAARKSSAAQAKIDPTPPLTSTLAPHLLAQRVEDGVPLPPTAEQPAAGGSTAPPTDPAAAGALSRDAGTPSGPAPKMAGLGATASSQTMPAAQGPISVAPPLAGDAFPGLRESLTVLTSAAPGVARQTLSTLPQPNAALSATLLLFLAAVRGGDIRGWMGDRTQRALEAAGRGELVGRVAAELGAARQAGEPPAGDWRPTMIPLYNDGELSAIRLSVPQRNGGEGQEEDGDGDGDQRFVIDLDLSRLGPTQLEGRLNAGRLSLTMRTRAPLEIGMRQEISGILATACESIGLAGAMTFQSGTDHWVDVAASRKRQRAAAIG